MGSPPGTQIVQPVVDVLPCASTVAAATGWLPVHVFEHCRVPVTGRSGVETEQHDTAPSAWAGEGGRQAHGLGWTHVVLQEW